MEVADGGLSDHMSSTAESRCVKIQSVCQVVAGARLGVGTCECLRGR